MLNARTTSHSACCSSTTVNLTNIPWYPSTCAQMYLHRSSAKYFMGSSCMQSAPRVIVESYGPRNAGLAVFDDFDCHGNARVRGRAAVEHAISWDLDGLHRADDRVRVRDRELQARTIAGWVRKLQRHAAPNAMPRRQCREEPWQGTVRGRVSPRSSTPPTVAFPIASSAAGANAEVLPRANARRPTSFGPRSSFRWGCTSSDFPPRSFPLGVSSAKPHRRYAICLYRVDLPATCSATRSESRVV